MSVVSRDRSTSFFAHVGESVIERK